MTQATGGFSGRVSHLGQLGERIEVVDQLGVRDHHRATDLQDHRQKPFEVVVGNLRAFDGEHAIDNNWRLIGLRLGGVIALPKGCSLAQCALHMGQCVVDVRLGAQHHVAVDGHPWNGYGRRGHVRYEKCVTPRLFRWGGHRQSTGSNEKPDVHEGGGRVAQSSV